MLPTGSTDERLIPNLRNQQFTSVHLLFILYYTNHTINDGIARIPLPRTASMYKYISTKVGQSDLWRIGIPAIVDLLLCTMYIGTCVYDTRYILVHTSYEV